MDSDGMTEQRPRPRNHGPQALWTSDGARHCAPSARGAVCVCVCVCVCVRVWCAALRTRAGAHRPSRPLQIVRARARGRGPKWARARRRGRGRGQLGGADPRPTPKSMRRGFSRLSSPLLARPCCVCVCVPAALGEARFPLLPWI